MNITFISNNIVNEGFGDRCSSFNHYDKVIGPDGTIYDTAQIIGLVNAACEELSILTGGLINEYLAALPIVYTFQYGTMATDGEYIYINPGFVLELLNDCGGSAAGIAFVILHEIYHNLYLHKEREAANPLKFSDHRKANCAQDYEINWVIEHTFADQRSAVEADLDDPDDSPFEVDGKTRKQLFGGITKLTHGLIDDKYAGMPWEKIYDMLPNTPAETPEDEENEIKLSPDFKNGYRDGWEAAIRELRAKGLVESVKIDNGTVNKLIKLFEASGSDYDTGYDTGYAVAMNVLSKIMQGGGGPMGPQSGPDGPAGPKIEKIDGLTPLKPINPPAQLQNSDKSSSNNPNTPVDLSNASKTDSQGDSGPQKDGPQTDGPQRGGSQPDGPQTDGKFAPTTSQEQLDDIKRKGEQTLKIGIADGKYTGKTGNLGNNDSHIISKDEGDIIRKNAGMIEPGGTDVSKQTGKIKSPFDAKNIKKIENTIKQLSKLGMTPGSGVINIDIILKTMTDALTPKINWKEELRTRFDACCMKLVDAGWNKKQLSYDAYSRFDDWEGEGKENIIIMVDTSGSIFGNGEHLNQVIREFNDIAKEVEPGSVDIVLFCDGIYYHKEFDLSAKLPDLQKEFKGHLNRGGTSFKDCFKYIDQYYIKKGRDFACCVIFTDLDVVSCAEAGELPEKTKLSWDPGTVKDDDAKLLWMILNDEKRKIEMPYGGIIQMSTRDFLKSINESLQYTNKLNIPRRTCMNTKPINEAFKKVSALKADAILKDDNDILPTKTILTPEQNAKKRIADIQYRNTAVQAWARERGIDEVKKMIFSWLAENTTLTTKYGYNSNYNDIFPIEDDLRINIKRDEFDPRKSVNLALKGYALNDIPNYIIFGDIPGNLEIGFNNSITKLPPALMTASVGKDFICTNMPNLRTLENGPMSVRGNYIVMQCKKLESLNGAPISKTAFDGYFLSDTKFDDEDFFNTVKNGGIMPSDNEVVKESLSDNRTKVNRLVESRLALGKYYTTLNEAFSSKILTRLANIPENKEALETMRNMKIFWSDIPDDIITPVYNSVTKVIQARRVVNGDKSKFGITICCDKDDRIRIIASGDNLGDWRGKTWLYFDNNVLDEMYSRAKLVHIANSIWEDEARVKKVQDKLSELGINWEKTDIQRLDAPLNGNQVRFAHLYLVPEYCARTYVIKGADDNKSAASKDPEFARNFSYLSQNTRRTELANKRLTDISGSFMRGDLASGPAMKKYLAVLIDNAAVKKLGDAYRTNTGILNALNNLKDSVKNVYNKVNDELEKANKDSLITGKDYAMLYLRIMKSTYNSFNRNIDSMIDMTGKLKDNQEGYYNAMNKRSSLGSQTTLANIKRPDIADKSPVIDRIKIDSYDDRDNPWYRYYMITLKTFAEVLSAIAAIRRGDTERFKSYINTVEKKILNRDSYAFDDEYYIIGT